METVRAVGRDPKTFSSEPTTMIPDGSTMGDADHQNLIFLDPPKHTAQRKLIVKDFLPKAARALQPRIQELSAKLVDGVAADGGCDLVEDLSGVLASYVIAELLGIPIEDGRLLYDLTEIIQRGSTLTEGPGLEAVNQMFGYAHSVWTDRLAKPVGPDLASRMVHGDIDGKPVDEMDFNLYFLLLINAGGDTSRNVIGGGMLELLRDRDLYRILHDNVEDLLPTAVEEMIRWVSPVIYQRRRVTQPATIRDHTFEVGEKVVMFYAAANFDPAVFRNPRRFDITRSPNEHVAFGAAGPHFCLGAHVARIEIAAMVRELVTRFPAMRLSGPPVWSLSTIMNGPINVPVEFA